MSGHSHWAGVKHKKALTDAKKSKAISKMMNAILIAVKDGPNPETNYKLKIAIDRAKAVGVLNENIERVLKKASGDLKEDNLEELTYEAYGPENVALLIKATTDNRNRTFSEIRQILNNFNGKMADPGSATWLFEERGVIFALKEKFKDDLIDQLIGLGLIDWQDKDGEMMLITEPQSIGKVINKLKEANVGISDGAIQYLPKNPVKLAKESEASLERLVETLLDQADVQDVYINAE